MEIGKDVEHEHENKEDMLRARRESMLYMIVKKNPHKFIDSWAGPNL